MSELRPCPFCGQDNDTHRNDCYFMIVSKADTYDKQYPYVSFDKPTKEDIIKAWNNRPHEAKIKAEAVRGATPNILSMAGSFWKNFYRGRWVLTNKLEKGEL